MTCTCAMQHPGCPAHKSPADSGRRVRGYGSRVYSALKRLVVGRPIATSELEHQRLRKLVALPTFSSDALSSTAYATEEILFVVAAGSSSLALGLSRLVPLSIVVAILLPIAGLADRQ